MDFKIICCKLPSTGKGMPGKRRSRVPSLVTLYLSSESWLFGTSFGSSQLGGATGPGVLRTLRSPTAGVPGRGRGGRVSGSSSRFLIDGWTDLGANRDRLAATPSCLETCVRRR
ncbi:predicted protein [Histoplasma capsulatum H143]|nr:predicted protein [Histoplasma capsulatum H143]